MTSDTPWLTEEQQHVWRRWLQLHRDLSAILGREMQESSALSMADFEVLVHLTDVPEGRLRVSELAGAMDWERSRLSHHIKRMEGRHMVDRRGCPDDGRGAFVSITPTGRAAIEQAAPDHVRAVRRLFVDVLSEEELGELGRIIEKLLTTMQPRPGTEKAPVTL
jgi:DNA-binding MarR family transcriptional regulator